MQIHGHPSDRKCLHQAKFIRHRLGGKSRLNQWSLHYSNKSKVGYTGGRHRRERETENNIRGLKLLSRGQELLQHPLHSRLSFISHSNLDAKSVTLINRPARNTNQYCRRIINPLCSQSSLQR